MRKHEPVPEEMMKWLSPKNTICQVLRDIYWKTDDPDIKLQCRIATSMAKSMTQKIVELHGNDRWADKFWDENPKFLKFLRWKKKLNENTRSGSPHG